jgi:hypothetical protein
MDIENGPPHISVLSVTNRDDGTSGLSDPIRRILLRRRACRPDRQGQYPLTAFLDGPFATFRNLIAFFG